MTSVNILGIKLCHSLITFIGATVQQSPTVQPTRPIFLKITSGFILVNSVAGLLGQLMKAGDYSPIQPWLEAWPLFVAVLIGGQIGSRLGAYHLPETWVKRLTAALMIYVSIRLIWRWFEMTFT